MNDKGNEKKQENGIRCPKCGSDQITANKKGFGVGKAIAGDVLLGPIGMFAGGVGSNKVLITCLSCGKQFKPGEDLKSELEKKEQNKGMLETKFGRIFLAIFLILLVAFLMWIGIPFWYSFGFVALVFIMIVWKAYS